MSTKNNQRTKENNSLLTNILKENISKESDKNNNTNNNNYNYEYQQSSESEYYFHCDKNTNFGKKIWKDGSIFFGYYENNLANGWGIFHHYDSEIFKGEFVNNEVNGFGEYIHKNGFINVGYWANNSQVGIGYEIMGKTCIYLG